ncbi:MAG: hypothetical protein ACLP2H_18770 [Terriglobales bacterium]
MNDKLREARAALEQPGRSAPPTQEEILGATKKAVWAILQYLEELDGKDVITTR